MTTHKPATDGRTDGLRHMANASNVATADVLTWLRSIERSGHIAKWRSAVGLRGGAVEFVFTVDERADIPEALAPVNKHLEAVDYWRANPTATYAQFHADCPWANNSDSFATRAKKVANRL